VRTCNTTKGLQDPHHGGSQPTTPADLLAAAPTRPGSRPRRLRWRRPLLALVALTAAAALAAGCGTSGSGSGSGSGGGGGIYGGAAPSGTTPSGTTPSGVATVATASNSLGTILVDGGGRTLYLFEKDQPNRSACSGACVAAWPVDPTSGTPKAGSGVQASLLGTITRADGSTQSPTTDTRCITSPATAAPASKAVRASTPSAPSGSLSRPPVAPQAHDPDRASRVRAASAPTQAHVHDATAGRVVDAAGATAPGHVREPLAAGLASCACQAS
jgi:predicted lipoprotein with Yx(FWY)xxD motif